MFSIEIYEIFKNTYFEKHLQPTASEICMIIYVKRQYFRHTGNFIPERYKNLPKIYQDKTKIPGKSIKCLV